MRELHTLQIHSLSFYKPRDLSEEENDIFYSREDSSKITRVYFENMFDMEDIHFLMAFCPYIEYLKVGSINNINVELFFKISIQANYS